MGVFRRKRAAAPKPPRMPRHSRMDRYSRLLGLAKIVLPGTGLALLAVALLWQDIVPQALSGRSAQRFGAEQLRRHEMSLPKYVGSDEKNQQYQMEAKSARLADASSDTVILELPKANIALENGNSVAITSRAGEFNQKLRIMILSGDVHVYHDANYTFRTERAIYDAARNRAWGDVPVVAFGPKGRIEAKGFRIEDKGQTIVFTGKTKVLLNFDQQDMKDITGKGNEASSRKTAPASRRSGE
jgi:lipopolysaccharide export system protein LptC